VRKSLLFAAVLLAITALSGRAQASGHNTHIYLLKGLAGIFSTGLGVLDENWSNAVTTPPFILTIFTTRSQKRSPGCKEQ